MVAPSVVASAYTRRAAAGEQWLTGCPVERGAIPLCGIDRTGDIIGYCVQTGADSGHCCSANAPPDKAPPDNENAAPSRGEPDRAMIRWP